MKAILILTLALVGCADHHSITMTHIETLPVCAEGTGRPGSGGCRVPLPPVICNNGAEFTEICYDIAGGNRECASCFVTMTIAKDGLKNFPATAKPAAEPK